VPLLQYVISAINAVHKQNVALLKLVYSVQVRINIKYGIKMAPTPSLPSNPMDISQIPTTYPFIAQQN